MVYLLPSYSLSFSFFSVLCFSAVIQQRKDAKWPVQMRGSAAARARCRTEYTHGRTQCDEYPANRW